MVCLSFRFQGNRSMPRRPSTAKETLAVLRKAEEFGVRGGGIYDSLHLAAARKIDAREIYTLYLRHFRVFALDLAARLVGV